MLKLFFCVQLFFQLLRWNFYCASEELLSFFSLWAAEEKTILKKTAVPVRIFFSHTYDECLGRCHIFQECREICYWCPNEELSLIWGFFFFFSVQASHFLNKPSILWLDFAWAKYKFVLALAKVFANFKWTIVLQTKQLWHLF